MATSTSSSPPPEQHLSLAPSKRREAPSERDALGNLKVAIGKRIVRLMRDHTGQGPRHAKTALSRDLIVISLAGCLTPAEQGLAKAGHESLVRSTRGALHDAMRADVIAVIQELTGREVAAFLADQQLDPDLAVIVLVLKPFALRSA